MFEKEKLKKIIKRIEALKIRAAVTCSGNASGGLADYIKKKHAEHNKLIDEIVVDLSKETIDIEAVVVKIKLLEPPKDTGLNYVQANTAFGKYVAERHEQQIKSIEEIITDLRKVVKKK